MKRDEGACLIFYVLILSRETEHWVLDIYLYQCRSMPIFSDIILNGHWSDDPIQFVGEIS